MINEADFSTLGLSDEMLAAVQAKGFESPTSIQRLTIPRLLSGENDIIAQSQTGTGKTAAFGLPILQQIEPSKEGVQSIILVPTRELAVQAAEELLSYNRERRLSITAIYGGAAMSEQLRRLSRGVDIVVGTPGRVLDHIRRGTLKLDKVRFLVLDEADEMLNMGFLEDMETILSQLPEERQTLMFSATMPPVIAGFAKWCLTDPAEVTIARREVAATISHAFYPVALDQRDELLLALLKGTDFRSVMIFTRTRKEADAVCGMLKHHGYRGEVAVMHSDIPQKERMEALKGFKSGKYDILVATDVAARGIDISGVTHVINYRVPENAEDYVHRIGRTGRAEASGDAFTIMTADELDFAAAVENFIGKPIERKKLDGFNYTYTALLEDKPVKSVRKPKPAGPKRRRR